ncbi:hypothetical protein PHYBLDRAFT_73852 [Phycomyces blakesleeanus NRRL 1555(-)]|uniref:Uncharacterized protein n=1 Tax=Phycomyces blakesleeanus (strain ATCC 8743b / DSM 1359 / FGSC 10004 / NBRC 33097 / NRRL 1555) TaxID=763407 RepID=A0A167PHK3_PHYB8|nr:hypothetical protein PHYBLDRAFT_73852 [Phycomyces blakesleeanus NRRL 1555(-)]OAD77927.1 hypothetical protein PHYBLDRAFT_73852 [Phycomyces blakesleeanus NRRL 1555(-)]|eukprot:XP_018295967.1 hypothetical protein PHYBLDRAFT_73852 [Phycomyces blakesleeanus NRRL 1555(-)]
MSKITKAPRYQCRTCKSTFNNSRTYKRCLERCMTNRAELLANGEVSQTVSLPDQSQFTSAMVPNLAFGENINTSSSEDMDIIDSTEDDESMYDFGEECENVIDEIEGTTPSLVFDFSQPLPVPSNDDKKNLAFMQLIQEFGISRRAHEKIVEHFNQILDCSINITYRACSPHLGNKLLERFSEGMEVKTPTTTIRAKVHVLMATGDIPALAKLACHVGHTSKNGCRICHVVGQTPKHGQYFRMLPGTQTRSLESFRNYNLASSEDRKGLNGQSPLASMETFSGPFFFALDEMHGLCHGIGKQVWGLVRGKYGIKHPLCLSLATQREIGAAMVAAKSTIPTSLHGAWRDVTKNAGFFRAVDWADFLLFVVPTLVAERVQDLVARNALLGLVQTCNLLMSWELSAEDQTSIRSNLVEWNLFLESLLSTADIDIGVFTINQHIIQHYPQMIDLYGPPRAYSTRSVERAIGEYSRSIKSNSQVSVNAGNIMIRLAQSRRVAELTTVANTKTPPANLLVYSAYTDGWPVTEGGDPANAECEIEFWGPLKNLTIFDSFEDRSHLSLLLKTFYDLKGEEFSMLEPSIKTSRKAYLNGCVIDAAFNQSSTREACHVHVQLQVDMNSRRSRSYRPGYKHFFGKVVIFFQHVHNSKRWPLALITIYSVHLKNGLPITSVVKPKTIVIHASDIVELVGLVPSNVNGSHYIIWPSLKRGPKLTLGALSDI